MRLRDQRCRARAPREPRACRPGPEPLNPASAHRVTRGNSHLAVLRQNAARVEPDPLAAVLTFYESAYRAVAGSAGWDIAPGPHRGESRRSPPTKSGAAHARGLRRPGGRGHQDHRPR
ncbi:DUF5996 family protein [Streptomyces flaveolus]|uniref:DUF5996 family protein n=1 Tax=Streptomyces flaveolus TaxID=67297 RepID=UPI003412DB37